MTLEEFRILCQGRNWMQTNNSKISKFFPLNCYSLLLDNIEHLLKVIELRSDCIKKNVTPQAKAAAKGHPIYDPEFLRAIYLPFQKVSSREASKWLKIAEYVLPLCFCINCSLVSLVLNLSQ